MGILKECLELPVGKRKPGCEAGVVAMATKAGEMHSEAKLFRALKKRPDIRKKGGAGC